MEKEGEREGERDREGGGNATKGSDVEVGKGGCRSEYDEERFMVAHMSALTHSRGGAHTHTHTCGRIQVCAHIQVQAFVSTHAWTVGKAAGYTNRLVCMDTHRHTHSLFSSLSHPLSPHKNTFSALVKQLKGESKLFDYLHNPGSPKLRNMIWVGN